MSKPFVKTMDVVQSVLVDEFLWNDTQENDAKMFKAFRAFSSPNGMIDAVGVKDALCVLGLDCQGRFIEPLAAHVRVRIAVRSILSAY